MYWYSQLMAYSNEYAPDTSGLRLLTSTTDFMFIFHNLGSPLCYRTLIVDLMRNFYIFNACKYIHSIYKCFII